MQVEKTTAFEIVRDDGHVAWVLLLLGLRCVLVEGEDGEEDVLE